MIDGRFILIDTLNYWIHDSYFSLINGLNHGSSIFVNNIAFVHFMIERSYFTSCTTSTLNGGAIHFNSPSGSIIIERTCSIMCRITSSTTARGQFAYLRTANYKTNSLNSVSVSFCSPISVTSHSALYLEGGIQKISSLNSSFNNANTVSGFQTHSGTSCNIVFSTFFSDYSILTCFYFQSGNNLLDQCNIVNNTQKNITNGILRNDAGSFTIVRFSIFLSNSIQHLIGNSGIFHIYNCWLETMSFSGTTPISLNIYNPTETFQIQHFGSFECFANNPIELISTPYPIPNSTLNQEFSFNNYYFGVNFISSESINSRIQLTQPFHYWIHDSLFSFLNGFSNNGGSISFSLNLNVNILIETCLFWDCFTSLANGGAIYISTTLGSLSLDRVCAYSCMITSGSTNHGQFIFLSQGTNMKSEINFSSAQKCAPLIVESHSCIYLINGFQIINNLNLSHNKAASISGIRLSPTRYSTIFYSSLNNNSASQTRCIELNSNYHEFFYLNIVENTQSLLNNGIIRTEVSTKSIFSNSIFVRNSLKYLFSNAGEMQIYECYIDEYMEISGVASFYNIFIGLTSTFSLSQLKTAFCDSCLPNEVNSSSQILPLHNFNKSNFNLFYPDVSYLNSSFSNIRFTTSIPNNYWIHDSIFFELSSSDSGSCFYVLNLLANFVLERCYFHKCFSSNTGGVIFFSSTTGSSILDKIFAFECFSQGLGTHFGHFAYLLSSTQKKNFINYLSITFCSSNLAHLPSSSINQRNGLQILCSSNISYCVSNSVSSFQSNNPAELMIYFCSFIHNFAVTSKSISFNGGFNILTYSNIINNTQGTTSSGCIHIAASSYVRIQTVIMDKNTRLSLVDNSGETYILNCSCDFFSSTGTSPIYSLTSEIKPSYSLNHFGNYNISTEYGVKIDATPLPSININFEDLNVFEKYLPSITFINAISISYPIYSTSNDNYLISNSFFYGMKTSLGTGAAAVTITNSFSSSVVIEKSTFFDCSSSSSNGGAILFQSTTGSIFLEKICAFQCKIDTGSNNGQFCYITCSNIKKIQFILSSIRSCSPITVTSLSSIYLPGGLQKIEGLNSSENFAHQTSSIGIYSAMKSEITFSTIFNNSAVTHSAMFISNGANEMKNLNIVGNIHFGSSVGCITNIGTSITSFHNSFFLNNHKLFLFFNQGELTLYSCSCDFYSIQSISPTIYNLLSETSTISLVHINTVQCLANIPNENLSNPNPFRPLNSSNYDYYYYGMDTQKMSGVNIRFSTTISESFLIHDSLFLYLTHTSSGSALYFATNVINVLLERSYFQDCNQQASNNGGALYFYSTTGSCSLEKICASRCYINSGTPLGHFGYILISNLEYIKMNYISIRNCAPNSLTPHSSLYLHNGIQKISGLNSSNNIGASYSSIISNTTKLLFIQYSSFINNFGTSTGLIRLWDGFNSIVNTNFINNSQTATNTGIIRNDNSGITEFLYCYFFENTRTYLFHNLGTMKILNSWSDFFCHVSSSVSYFSNNNPMTKIPISFYSTGQCIQEISINLSGTPLPTIEIQFENSFHKNYYPDPFIDGRASSLRYYCEISGGFWIHDSEFLNLNVAAQGSALFFSGSLIINLLTERCSFLSCSTEAQHGGAIFFSLIDGSCSLDKICAFQCNIKTSGNYGQFAYSLTSVKKKNELTFSTISNCSPTIVSSIIGVFLQNGFIKLDSNNISKCKSTAASGIYISTGIEVELKMCNILENEANTTQIITFVSSTVEIKLCNMIKNKQRNMDLGIIRNHGSFISMRYCFFLDNSMEKLFSSTNNEFWISDSSIDYISTTLTSPNCYNITSISSSILIEHYETMFCPAEFPIEQPIPYFEKNIDYYKSNFNEYFYGLQYQSIFSQNLRFFSAINSNYWIHDSSFYDMLPFSGSAIYLLNILSHLLVERCIFIQCKSLNTNGGAIYFDSTSLGSCVLEKVCAINCFCLSGTTSGQFAYIITRSTKPNSLKVVSVSFCSSDQINTRNNAIYLKNGIQNVDSLNSSYNIVTTTSSICLDNPAISKIQFSSIINGYSTSATAIHFIGGSNMLIYSNIVNNSIITINLGVIRNISPSTTQMTKCIFLGNSPQYLFSNSGELQIYQCWADIFNSISTSPLYIEIESITSTHQIPHFKTSNCDAEIGWTLTEIIISGQIDCNPISHIIDLSEPLIITKIFQFLVLLILE